jgi:hypothetical protein
MPKREARTRTRTRRRRRRRRRRTRRSTTATTATTTATTTTTTPRAHTCEVHAQILQRVSEAFRLYCVVFLIHLGTEGGGGGGIAILGVRVWYERR